MTDPLPDERQQQIEAQARLAAIVESSDDAIVSKTLEGVITSWNKGAERTFGWTAEEVIGKPITIIIPTERLQEEPHILQRIQKGERVDHFETIRQRKDGRLIDVSVTISPVRNGAGVVIGVSKVARDITIQKRFHQELQAAKDAAERANRAKDHFLSILSHELRTPLTPVLAAASLMEADATLPAHIRENVEMMRRNVETEARLVDDLLDLTRIARGKVRLHFEVVDAHALVRNVVSMFHREIEDKGLTMAVSLRAKEFHIWADPGRFQQIALNLLSNAVKFTPADGTITVRTSNENGAMKLDMIDTGIGIESELLPRLFKAFEQGEQTVNRKFGGLGLGLSIVQSLVDMHGGSISASSGGTGKGATFSVRLPTLTDAQPGLAPGSVIPAMTAITGNPYRVLLVEDHDDTRRVLSRLLSSFGCAVTAAASVREAVELADRQPFDLLLSDIGLPDGSGLDVMRHLRERHKIRGIALSGFGQDDDVQRSREAGFDQHLTKPVNFHTLRQVILHMAG